MPHAGIITNTGLSYKFLDAKVDEKSGKVKETILTDATGSVYTVNQDGAVSKKVILASTIDIVQLDEFEKEILEISMRFLSEIQDYQVQKKYIMKQLIVVFLFCIPIEEVLG